MLMMVFVGNLDNIVIVLWFSLLDEVRFENEIEVIVYYL